MVLIGETERTRKLEVKQLHILSDVLWVIISIMYNGQFEGIKQVIYGKHTKLTKYLYNATSNNFGRGSYQFYIAFLRVLRNSDVICCGNYCTHKSQFKGLSNFQLRI
jgi:hypothetical protein